MRRGEEKRGKERIVDYLRENWLPFKTFKFTKWTWLLLKLLRESPLWQHPWHTYSCSLNHTSKNKSNTRFLAQLSLIA